MAAPLEEVRTFVTISAPTSGSDGTGAGQARLGDLLINRSTGIVYYCSAITASSGTGAANSAAVAASVTWTQIT